MKLSRVKILAATLCAVLLLTFVLTAFLEARHGAEHDCFHEQCETCACIHRTQQLVKALIPLLLLLFAAVGDAGKQLQRLWGFFVEHRRSLVLLGVRLNA